MTRFKLNARAFGGTGLFLIGIILIAPLWIGVFETGIIGNLSTNIVQIEDEVRHTFPTSQATMPLVFLMIISLITLVLILKEKRKRSK